MAFTYGYVSLEELLDWVRAHPLPSGRTVPVCIWGSRGIGKCVAGNTPVLVDHSWTPIESLWERHAGEVETDADGGQWKSLTMPARVIAFDEVSGEMRERRITRLYRQRVHEVGREVTFDGGRAIRMTNAHRLRGVSGWVRNVRPGDKVAVPARIPDPVEATCDDILLAELLAWQIGEGYEFPGRASVSITQRNRDRLEHIRSVAARVGDHYKVEMHSLAIYGSARGVHSLHINSREYQSFLVSLGYEWGHRSAGKRVPPFIARGSREVAQAFLRAFIAAEGHVNGAGHIEVASASQMLLEDIAALMLRFGIWMRITQRTGKATNGLGIERTYYRGIVSGRSLRVFAEEVGIDDEKKSEALRVQVARVSNENLDLVPVRDLARDARRLTGLPLSRIGLTSHFSEAGSASGLPRERALVFAHSLDDVASGAAHDNWEAGPKNNGWTRTTRLAFARASENSDAIANLAREARRRAIQEVRFITVRHVEPVLLDGWVYDLEVEEDHNYVAAGLVTHNTQQLKAYTKDRGIDLITYHPAHDSQGSDVVGIQYIDEANKRTAYAKPEWLPTESGRGGILFMDEINRAKIEVLQGLMEVIGEGTISQSDWELPEGWSIVCAANPAGKDYQVVTMDEAMINRMLHYSPGWNSPGWTRWAEREGIHRRIVDFALQNPDLVASGDTDLPYEVQPVATPRSMEYMASLYDEEMDLRMLETCAVGLLGTDAAEVVIEMHIDPVEPLDAAQVLRAEDDSAWRAQVDAWEAEGRDDLVRATGERIVAFIGAHEPRPSAAAERVSAWLLAIEPASQRELLRVMGESAGAWLRFFVDHPEYGIAHLVPENMAALRKPNPRELAERRQTRAELRKMAQRMAAGDDG